jgi:hypothetical protein
MLRYLDDTTLLILSDYAYKACRLFKHLCTLRQSVVHDSTFCYTNSNTVLFLQDGRPFHARIQSNSRLIIEPLPLEGLFIEVHCMMRKIFLVRLDGTVITTVLCGENFTNPWTEIVSPVPGKKIITATAQWPVDNSDEFLPIIVLENYTVWKILPTGPVYLRTPVPITALRSNCMSHSTLMLGVDGCVYCDEVPGFRLSNVLDILQAYKSKEHSKVMEVRRTDGVYTLYDGCPATGLYRIISTESNPILPPKLYRTIDKTLFWSYPKYDGGRVNVRLVY